MWFKPLHLQVGMLRFGLYVEGSCCFDLFRSLIFALSITEILLCEVNIHFPYRFTLIKQFEFYVVNINPQGSLDHRTFHIYYYYEKNTIVST